ncbi:GTP-binding protein, partial [Escherichia coli]|nr:GTP-binding protein [Escherichia coli]
GVAVVVNEVGAVGLDHHLLRRMDEEAVLIGGGCACCAERRDLVEALLGLLNRGEDLSRVVIETSGLADPSPILFTVA